jgi:hypothetical protein
MSDREAVEHVMRVENCDRRTARRLLAKAMARGDVRATGINTTTGRREIIPRDVWRQYLEENDAGDGSSHRH